jgi:hypothetical protein
MIGSLVVLPPLIATGALILLLLYGYIEIRKHHIGRISMVANVFLLWQVFYNNFALLPGFLQWYLNVGSILAVIGLLTYLSRSSLPSGFYKITFLLYGSLPVLIIIGAFLTGII